MSQTAFSLFLSVILRIFPLSLRWNSSSAPRSGRAASPAQHKHDSTSRCDLFPVKSAFGRGDRTDTGSPRHCDPNLREKANAQRFLNAPEIPRASNYPQLSQKNIRAYASKARKQARRVRILESPGSRRRCCQDSLSHLQQPSAFRSTRAALHILYQHHSACGVGRRGAFFLPHH